VLSEPNSRVSRDKSFADDLNKERGIVRTLIDEIVKARTSIKKSLNEGPGNKQKSEKSVDALEKENQELRSLIVDLTKRMESVELRLAKVEGKSTVQEGSAKPKDDDTGDDEFDLFASDEEDGEDDKEADEERKKLLDKYHDKKSKEGSSHCKVKHHFGYQALGR